jgi:imidazolonepropionase-like amidohydrolase
MNSRLTFVSLALLAGPGASGKLAPTSLVAQERAVAIRGGTVVTVDGPVIQNGTVVLRGGKIVAVGANVSIPSGAEIVEARGKYVLPGLVDAMTSIGFAGNDLNENSNPVTPELRAFEAYNPFGTFGSGKPVPLRNVEMLSGGVTTLYIASADATLISGQGAVLKTAGANLDALVLREPASMDMTLGEPPKRPARAANRDPATRMAEVAMIRQALIKAGEYAANRPQNPNAPRDLGMEALGKLLKKEFPARIQATSARDIRTAMGLQEEFGFDLVIDGAAAAMAHKEELARRKIPVVLGQVTHPYVSNEEIPSKDDYPAVDERTPGQLLAAGVKVAIASFSRAFGSLAPAGTGKWLMLDAAVAAGYGMAEPDILRAVTLTPAEILGVADRVGSLTVGKDADVIVLDGPPLSIKTWVERAYVNGELVHQKK